MKEFELDFKFKGDRNYVHGTDMYSKISEHLATNFNITDIDLSFHKVIKNNLKARFVPAGINPDTTNVAAIFRFRNNNAEPYTIHLFETAKEVTDRYEYDEEKIAELATLNFEDKSVVITSFIPYTNIEKIVALNKALLNKLLTDPGKWYFTKITVKTDINKERTDNIKLRLIKNIGSKITKTLILFNNEEKGYLYFSKV